MSVESDVEYVTCNLCGADNTALLFRAPTPQRYGNAFSRETWNIVRCRQCGLIYVNPRVGVSSLREFYCFENPADQTLVQEWFVDGADLQAPTWRRFLRIIHRYQPTGRLLDVGCGGGGFLVEARNLGYQVTGQDISPYFLDYCRSQHGLTVYGEELEALESMPGGFDCVTAFDVIEHHPDPKQMLTEIRRLLRPGGLAVVSTHDIGNLFARLYGVNWRHIHPVGHITYFTQTTLAKMLSATGFQVIHRGGLHTMDASTATEARNWLTQFGKVILLRSLILGFYRPLADHISTLTHWQFTWRGLRLDHTRLMMRVGQQIIMNDDMIFLAVAI